MESVTLQCVSLCTLSRLRIPYQTNIPLFHIHFSIGSHLNRVKGVRHQLLLLLLLHAHETVLRSVGYHAELDLVRLLGLCMKVAKPSSLATAFRITSSSRREAPPPRSYPPSYASRSPPCSSDGPCPSPRQNGATGKAQKLHERSTVQRE